MTEPKLLELCLEGVANGDRYYRCSSCSTDLLAVLVVRERKLLTMEVKEEGIMTEKTGLTYIMGFCTLCGEPLADDEEELAILGKMLIHNGEMLDSDPTYGEDSDPRDNSMMPEGDE